MNARIPTFCLALMAVPLAAQGAEGAPMGLVELRLDQSQQDLAAQVGDLKVLGFGAGVLVYANHDASGLAHTWMIKVDQDTFQRNAGANRASGVGVGVETTLYLNHVYDGLFFSAEFLTYQWQLTNTGAAPVATGTYVRPALSLAGGVQMNSHLGIGYRFTTSTIANGLQFNTTSVVLKALW